jgi:hypothetical protein
LYESRKMRPVRVIGTKRAGFRVDVGLWTGNSQVLRTLFLNLEVLKAKFHESRKMSPVRVIGTKQGGGFRVDVGLWTGTSLVLCTLL